MPAGGCRCSPKNQDSSSGYRALCGNRCCLCAPARNAAHERPAQFRHLAGHRIWIAELHAAPIMRAEAPEQLRLMHVATDPLANAGGIVEDQERRNILLYHIQLY